MGTGAAAADRLSPGGSEPRVLPKKLRRRPPRSLPLCLLRLGRRTPTAPGRSTEIISMMKLIRASSLSANNSLSLFRPKAGAAAADRLPAGGSEPRVLPKADPKPSTLSPKSLTLNPQLYTLKSTP